MTEQLLHAELPEQAQLLELRVAIEDTYATGMTSICNHGLDAAELAWMSRPEIGGEQAHTYGDSELDPILQLVNLMRTKPVGPQDVFYDLGSGNGRLAMLVAAISNTALSVGVELSPTRHTQAIAAQEMMVKRSPGDVNHQLFVNRLKYFCSNILDHDLADATLVYSFCLCLDDPFLRRLEERLLERLPAGAHVLLRGKPFPHHDASNPGAFNSNGKRLDLILRQSMYYGYRVAEKGDEHGGRQCSNAAVLRPGLKQIWERLGNSPFHRAVLASEK